MTRFFAGVLFLGAFLLFCSQPMVGKMMLPLLGGAASVWTAAMLFFQVALLAGYLYAHVLARCESIAKQTVIHLLLMTAAFFFLPLGFSAATVNSGAYRHPVLWELASLARAAGVPYLMTATTAPLLQSWFSRMRGAGARDPYFLYAASNAGSLLGLIAYPLVLEPNLGVRAQSMAWTAGYGLLLLAVLVAAGLLRKEAMPLREREAAPAAAPDWQARGRWLLAAGVASGLLLAVTTHISVNLTPMPLVWTIPLAVYLATFIFAFGRNLRISSALAARLLPPVIVLLCPVVGMRVPVVFGIDIFLIGAHMSLLFAGALACHTALADARPGPSRLTGYYLWIALGGALGGAFAAMAAPVLFKTVFEYPLLLAAAMFFRKPSGRLGLTPAILAVMILAYGLLLPGYVVEQGTTVAVQRNFFGVKRVVDMQDGVRKLFHGDTLHGLESLAVGQQGKPQAYYHPDGAFGDVMRAMARPRSHVGVVGLGAGSIAAYAGPDRHVTFFEIDPGMEPIARRYFTFLDGCGPNCDVVPGDGRLALVRYPESAFDLLILDAFNSDAIPPHLLSREALLLYRSRIKPEGAILFHVSNRYLKVKELVSTLAAEAAMPALVKTDENVLGTRSRATFVMVAKSAAAFGELQYRAGWRPAQPAPGLRAWTDDHSDLIGLLRWDQ